MYNIPFTHKILFDDLVDNKGFDEFFGIFVRLVIVKNRFVKICFP